MFFLCYNALNIHTHIYELFISILSFTFCALSALRVSIATRPLLALTTTAPSSEY